MKHPIPGVRIASTGARGRFSGAHEFKHGGLSYEDEALDGLEAHLSEGGQPRPSQFGDLEVSVPASGSNRGWP